MCPQVLPRDCLVMQFCQKWTKGSRREPKWEKVRKKWARKNKSGGKGRDKGYPPNILTSPLWNIYIFASLQNNIALTSEGMLQLPKPYHSTSKTLPFKYSGRRAWDKVFSVISIKCMCGAKLWCIHWRAMAVIFWHLDISGSLIISPMIWVITSHDTPSVTHSETAS